MPGLVGCVEVAIIQCYIRTGKRQGRLPPIQIEVPPLPAGDHLHPRQRLERPLGSTNQGHHGQARLQVHQPVRGAHTIDARNAEPQQGPIKPDLQIPRYCAMTYQYLMITAQVNILTDKRQPIRCRALLDTGFSMNFISRRLANSLGIRQKKCSVSIGVLDTITTTAR